MRLPVLVTNSLHPIFEVIADYSSNFGANPPLCLFEGLKSNVRYSS